MNRVIKLRGPLALLGLLAIPVVIGFAFFTVAAAFALLLGAGMLRGLFGMRRDPQEDDGATITLERGQYTTMPEPPALLSSDDSERRPRR